MTQFRKVALSTGVTLNVALAGALDSAIGQTHGLLKEESSVQSSSADALTSMAN